MKNFTAKQKEIVARKLGYDGPMQGFDDFLNSSPALGMKYATITDKFATRMAKGGAVTKAPVKKYQEGGAVTGGVSREEAERLVRERFATIGRTGIGAAAGNIDQAGFENWVGNLTSGAIKPQDLNTTFKGSVEDYIAQNPDDKYSVYTKDFLSKSPATGGTTGDTTKNTDGSPKAPTATTYTAAQTAPPTGATVKETEPVQASDVTNVAAPTPITTPTPIAASTATAASAASGVTDTLSEVTAQQGTVSEGAKAVAAQQAPETTAVAGVQAAQGVAGTVQGAPTRVVQAGEMVSGPAVNMDRAEEIMARTQAAQGVVTEEMTIQGQLNKLTRDFDAGNPPPWAAASMRAATAQLAARGLGASSMAGQAIIQATLEAATPIAAADAKVFEAMGLQNLSNRQQTAMLIGQQRAVFLGQEFDQAFQTKVMNAAKISDIANKNFDAQTTIAIENSRLANSMDIANLSAKNAVVLGKMAAMSQLETQNLSNRQQVAIENAKSVLQMDIKNLDNRQQTALFKAQEMNDALVSDAGFANAVSITNAANKLEADKISATLAQTAEQFNAEQLNKVNTTNALAANDIGKFNAQQANAREEFNANMYTQVNIANAKILAEISTANTAATNAAAAVNAKNATDLSSATYAQEMQLYRDKLEMSWKMGESEKERANNIVTATITANSAIEAARVSANSKNVSVIGEAVVKSAVGQRVIDKGLDWASDFLFGKRTP